ncbi:MAG: glycosyltransferase [Deltaproteobacteria bacterium]|nr:glycosyltransferase [Deltaproteobacteria bacterium]
MEKEPPRYRLVALLCMSVVAFAAHQCALQAPTLAIYLKKAPWGKTFLYVSIALALVTMAELVWRTILVLMYRPVQGCEDDLLPTCAVIVPAYNEGKQVFETLLSIAASDYPKDKLRLIAIDDGSVDDTWHWIQKAAEVLRERITTIRLPHNQGKRHALYAGMRKADDEVLVTVDSDSMVTADTLRNLVSPLAVDERIGAVAGNVRVLNVNKGIIPKMLEVIFVFSFDFIRASQSMVRTVMCTPGALSAYRRDIVMRVLQEWLEQTFCGQPANIGEDRAMTNLILREGYHVLFQRNAVVFTEVPVKYANLCKMYLRWARSDIRETIAMTRFVFKPFRADSMIGARINLILSWIALGKVHILLAACWGLVLLQPLTFGLNAFFGVILSSSLAAVIYALKFSTLTSLWGYLYGLYYFLSLSWITPYALLTPHKSGWLTRQIPNQGTINPHRNGYRRNSFGATAKTAEERAFLFPQG